MLLPKWPKWEKYTRKPFRGDSKLPDHHQEGHEDQGHLLSRIKDA